MVGKATVQILLASQAQPLAILNATQRAQWYIVAKIGNGHNCEGSNKPEYAAWNNTLCLV